MAVWLALVDLYLPGDRLVQAGTTFSDSGPGALVPSTWPPPTGAVHPQDPDATAKYWAQGPRGHNTAEYGRQAFMNGQRWSDQNVPAATIYWQPNDVTKPHLGYVLSGRGSNLGVFPTV